MIQNRASSKVVWLAIPVAVIQFLQVVGVIDLGEADALIVAVNALLSALVIFGVSNQKLKLDLK